MRRTLTTKKGKIALFKDFRWGVWSMSFLKDISDYIRSGESR